MAGLMDRHPGFWGIAGNYTWPEIATGHAQRHSRAIWCSEDPDIRLYVHGDRQELVMSWHDMAKRRDAVSALVFGSVLVASDSDYADSTRVEPLDRRDAPDVVARLYGQHGPAAFAFLDGNFLVVLWDSDSRSVFLVVDKFACNDIFVRQAGDHVLFASDCDLLLDDSAPWDPNAVGFFLAQQGFVPGPCTLSPSVRSVGRARYLQICNGHDGLRINEKRYWKPSANWQLPSTEIAEKRFFEVIKSASATRFTRRSSLLLSAGVDSSLLLNVVRPLAGPDFMAITGAIKGYSDGERDIAKAASLAQTAGVRHVGIVMDPADESIPEEWVLCTSSWMTGTRITFPLFRRFGVYLNDRLGDGFTVLSGQMADTLADNNYTFPSAGYTLRRIFCSSWFLSLLPLARLVSPAKNGIVHRRLIDLVSRFRGPRFAGMMDSVLDGLSATERFYTGRVFGYGEMPGRSAAYFPALTPSGFEAVADWYSSRFIKPVVSDLTRHNFYRNMIELSMDMVMLHLDTRPAFHSFRLTGGTAQLPFLDARVVNFFCSLPYSARAVYRKPKHVIREQFRRQHLAHYSNSAAENATASSQKSLSADELLFRGTLGAYCRELLQKCTLPDRVPALFEFIDESYFTSQVRSFRRGESGTDYSFITRLAALELWSQNLCGRKVTTQSFTTPQLA